MYYKIIISNSNNWIEDELLYEMNFIFITSHQEFKKTGFIYIKHKNNYLIIYNFSYIISEEDKFKQRLRLVEFIKKHKTYIHFHFCPEQKQIIKKMLNLSNKTYKERLIDFYVLHNSSKLEDIDSILYKYSNNIELLFCKLKKQYKSKLEIF
jgi:hypothetical protein